MGSDTNWITIIAAIFLVRWLAFEAVAEHAVRRRGVLVFRAPLGLRILFGFALPTMVYGAGSVIMSPKFHEEWWVSVILMVMAGFIAWEWPSEIGLTKTGLYEQKVFESRKRKLEWRDIDYVAPDPSEDSVQVVSKSGLAIKHTKYHVDRARFVAEINSHLNSRAAVSN